MSGYQRLIILRPEPGAQATLAAARARGVEAHAFPSFEIEAAAWDAPTPDHFDAVLAGSANAFRHGGFALESFSHLPVLAVGEVTAKAAKARGFEVERTGSGGLQTLLDDLPVDDPSDPQPRRILRLCGEVRTALSIKPHLSLEERVVYRTRALPMAEGLKSFLTQAPSGKGNLAALHSAAAAKKLAEDCACHGLPKEHIGVLALGPRIADAAGDGWAKLHIAEQPSDGALIELAAQLCKKTGIDGLSHG